MNKLVTLIILGIFFCGFLIAGSKDPVTFLFQVKGNVEYTKFGKKWKRVRRRSTANEELKIETARHIVLSDEHRSLVWENLGNQFSYELTVGTAEYLIPPSNENIVSVELNRFPNTATVSIKAFRGREQISELAPYKSKGLEKKHTAHWMTDEEKEEFNRTFQTISANHAGNLFMLGSYLEKEGMWTAAMNYYKQYLLENPDEIEMTPYLFRIYKKLKLKKIYNRELNIWKMAMKE